MSKIKLDDIQNELRVEGWKLISTSYSNLDSELEYECPEGHRVFASWKKMRGKCECPVCRQNTFKTDQFNIVPKKRGVYRTFAIDQATHVCGWSVFDGNDLIAYGKYNVPDEEEIARTNAVKNWVLSMIDNWHPDKVAIEGIQLQEFSATRAMGVQVFQALARLQGVLLDAIYTQHLSSEVCHTAQWRSHCGVRGKTRAEKKRSMQDIIKKTYDVSVTDDEADAIGIGKYASSLVPKQQIFNWE